MKKQTLLFGCLALCLFPFYSCVKPPPDVNPADGNNVYSGCRIKKTVSEFLTFNGLESPITRQFTYNSKGDPVSIIVDHTSTGNANLNFKYDNKGRLVEYNAGYPNGGYDFRHRYTYSQDRITIDSSTSGNQDPTGAPPAVIISYLSYDKLNRIVKDSVIVNSKFFYITTYSYDADGNKINEGAVYDKKLNPHRLNKVWMLIDRDYSVNNQLGASTYNSVGLPLTYPERPHYYDPGVFRFGYFGYASGKIAITYDCK